MTEGTSQVVLVVAVARNGVIGSNGQLPWQLRDDMALFRQITMGHPIIMGRKTYESIGKPLPGRTNIVVSRNTVAVWMGLKPASSIEEAIATARQSPGSDHICIIGGGEIYRQTLPLADIIYLTRVDSDVQGDVTFPELPAEDWRVVEEQVYEKGERNEYGFVFQKLIRI